MEHGQVMIGIVVVVVILIGQFLKRIYG